MGLKTLQLACFFYQGPESSNLICPANHVVGFPAGSRASRAPACFVCLFLSLPAMSNKRPERGCFINLQTLPLLG